MTKMQRSVRNSKGFLFEADDVQRAVVCRDVRGFPAAEQAARERGKPAPSRLVVIVPDLAMDDWLARWADDVGHARRALTVTRRTDGRQVRLVGTLLAYGYGVETAIQIERIEHEPRAAKGRHAAADDAPPKSGILDVGSTRAAVAPAVVVTGRRRVAT